jgi:hypothetical protein
MLACNHPGIVAVWKEEVVGEHGPVGQVGARCKVMVVVEFTKTT